MKRGASQPSSPWIFLDPNLLRLAGTQQRQREDRGRQDDRGNQPAAGAAAGRGMNPGVIAAIRGVENPDPADAGPADGNVRAADADAQTWTGAGEVDRQPRKDSDAAIEAETPSIT